MDGEQGSGGDLLERRRAALAHNEVELAAENGKYALDSGLAECRKAPNVGAADSNRGRAQRQRFVDVGTPPDASVQKHGNLAADRLNHFRKALNRPAPALFSASAVV